jgi:hypothetical protein
MSRTIRNPASKKHENKNTVKINQKVGEYGHVNENFTKEYTSHGQIGRIFQSPRSLMAFV